MGGLRDPEDPRNRLVEEYARLVATLGPSAWILENVPAMAKRSLPGNDSQLVSEWLSKRLGEDGYVIAASAVLNANRFGVPQDRRRLIAIGARDDVAVEMPDAITAGRPRVPGASPRPGELGHRDTPASLLGCPTVADALNDLPNLERFNELWKSDIVRLAESDRNAMQGSASEYARRLSGATDGPQRPLVA